MNKQNLAAQAISETCDKIKDLLLSKNAAYGNSAYEPVRCFHKGHVMDQINVRIDDKLSRLMRGYHAGEDVELDLIGYLVLKQGYSRYEELANSQSEHSQES